jgi:hypothetical protein
MHRAAARAIPSNPSVQSADTLTWEPSSRKRTRYSSSSISVPASHLSAGTTGQRANRGRSAGHISRRKSVNSSRLLSRWTFGTSETSETCTVFSNDPSSDLVRIQTPVRSSTPRGPGGQQNTRFFYILLFSTPEGAASSLAARCCANR